MLTIKERANKHELSAFIAHDTIGILIARAQTLARSGRRMTIVRSYPDRVQDAWNNGLTFPDVETGLTVDPVDPDVPDGRDRGIHIWEQPNPAGRGIQVLCKPGVESWGFSAYNDDGDEAAVRDRFQSKHPVSAARIVITGGYTPNGTDRSGDKIEILEYNKDGVPTMTVIAFDYILESERADHDAQLVEALRGAPAWDDTKLTNLANDLRNNWTTISEEMTRRHGTAPDTIADPL